jgi:hypothetical protein
MTENNNEQMDLGNGTASNNNAATKSNSEGTTTENTTSKLKLAIKTPKEKKDILIDGSSSVKQVILKKKLFF